MLPKIMQPTFDIKLPSNNKVVEFRPFLEREREVLLMALESPTAQDILKNIKKIIMACCMDDKFDVDNLPIFDIEYCFIMLKSKSIGEITETSFRCENIIDENEKHCNNIMNVDVDLTKVSVEGLDIDKKITLTPNLIVQMRFPSISDLEELSTGEYNDVIYTKLLIVKCLECIYNGDDIYKTKDCPVEEVYDFLFSLTIPQFRKIEQFFHNIPILRYSVSQQCSKCKFNHEFKFEGYESFFV